MGTLHESRTGEFRVRLVAHPSSVPTARRFVDEALTSWEHEDLVDDVGLCVSELSTNATLHSGSSYFEVMLQRAERGVRLTVLDGGVTGASAIASRVAPTAPVASGGGLSALDELVDLDALERALDPGLGQGAEGMTGRGLVIVSTLAQEWGIEDVEHGTRIWAEFVVGDHPLSRSAPVAPQPRPAGAPPPGDWYVVHLDGCPPGLLHAHDENLADIVRELQLMGAEPGRRSLAQAAVLAEVAGVVRRNALTWDAARLQVREAMLAGQAHVDIAVLAPRNVVEEVRRLRAAVTAAEEMATAGAMITLPASEPVQRLRDWMEEQFSGQTEGGREAVRFGDWMSLRG
ncbi:MAG: ATP-binding protein [Nocardioides sp.]